MGGGGGLRAVPRLPPGSCQNDEGGVRNEVLPMRKEVLPVPKEVLPVPKEVLPLHKQVLWFHGRARPSAKPVFFNTTMHWARGALGHWVHMGCICTHLVLLHAYVVCVSVCVCLHIAKV